MAKNRLRQSSFDDNNNSKNGILHSRDFAERKCSTNHYGNIPAPENRTQIKMTEHKIRLYTDRGWQELDIVADIFFENCNPQSRVNRYFASHTRGTFAL